MQNSVLIIDFGSQHTQLIAKAVRAQNIYCEICPFQKLPEAGTSFSAVILSDSPFSVFSGNAPQIELSNFRGKVPILAIGYSAHSLIYQEKGEITTADEHEILPVDLTVKTNRAGLFKNVSSPCEVWMSAVETIHSTPSSFIGLASTQDGQVGAFQIKGEDTYGIQFHPELHNSADGKQILSNFLTQIANIDPSWTPNAFAERTIENLKNKIDDEKVVLGLSGGVDSSVTAVLLHQAIGKNLFCIFVNHGLLRKDEFNSVLEQYKHLGLNVKGVDASSRFLGALQGISDPEKKRKIIGKLFIEVFEEEAQKIKDVKYLGQGTIYPDVIESVSIDGSSVAVKSHHNVGGLPERMNLKIIEPIRSLFKNEVREVGRALKMKPELLGRHPFPGPGLAIRIIGEITAERVKMLQEADAIFIDGLKAENLYEKAWQAGAILLPVNSVGVKDDQRTYEKVVALRAVGSTDGMTANWVDLPHDFLQRISNAIINNVDGINRVVYDISSKPPATIEWE